MKWRNKLITVILLIFIFLELFSIYKGNNKQFYADSDGDVIFSGNLQGATGMFSGLISGGEINTERAAITVLDEFRSGKLGRLSLEKPGDIK